jgi:hypothetical protein
MNNETLHAPCTPPRSTCPRPPHHTNSHFLPALRDTLSRLAAPSFLPQRDVRRARTKPEFCDSVEPFEHFAFTAPTENDNATRTHVRTPVRTAVCRWSKGAHLAVNSVLATHPVARQVDRRAAGEITIIVIWCCRRCRPWRRHAIASGGPSCVWTEPRRVLTVALAVIVVLVLVVAVATAGTPTRQRRSDFPEQINAAVVAAADRSGSSSCRRRWLEAIERPHWSSGCQHGRHCK